MADDTLSSEEQSLQQSGGGDGVSVHIESGLARRLELDDTTDVTLQLVDSDGSPEIRLTDLPTGITRAELQAHADAHNWEQIAGDDGSTMGDEDEWWYTFETADGVRIEADSTTHIKGNICNNLFVKSPPVEITEPETYYRAREIVAENESVSVSISDSEGLWQRLRASVDHDVESPPATETVQSLIDKVETVTVVFKVCESSLLLTPEELNDHVTAVENAHDAI